MSVPLSSKTNVWGIGIVMQSLLTSFYGTLTSGGEISDDADPPMAPSTVLRFGPLARQQYSKQLLDLIQECTAYEPMDRPGFPELLATIRQHVVAEDLTGGLRDATVGGPGFDLNLPRNTYAVGLTLQAIPAESNTPLPLAIGNDDRPDPEVTDNMGGPVGPYTS
jgi:serine/threonine protein kinase